MAGAQNTSMFGYSFAKSKSSYDFVRMLQLKSYIFAFSNGSVVSFDSGPAFVGRERMQTSKPKPWNILKVVR